jgi:putative component of membrane protein insertase Oxa1/YidC/SpoIIIJ protein YidD
MNIKSCLRTETRLLIFFSLALTCVSTALHSQSWETWEKVSANGFTEAQDQAISHRSDPLFRKMLKYYQDNVSPRQGPKCPASPSCSSFTLTAMSEYGAALGFIMGMDRIYFRENFDMKYLRHYRPANLGNNIIKVYDPVKANNIFAKKDWTIIDPDPSSRY